MKLKSFNKQKALHQLKNKHKREYNVKNRTIILSVLILILSIIFLTYARYENISNEFTIINAQVDDFSGDVKIISYNYDDGSGTVSAHSVPPAKDSGYKINTVSCDNASGTWDDSAWTITIGNITGKVKCNLTFDLITEYSDGVIAASPQLYDGLIPVTIDSSGTVKVADTSSEWYNYGSHNWANAVIVSNPNNYKTAGTTINMDDILQMYVWIPRYKYKLWNAANSSSNEQMINVEFESASTSKSTGSTNGNWLTHPAFTFGSTELEGFWVGKFETGYNGASDAASARVNSVDATKAIIKPNVYSWRSITVGNIFNTTRGVESESMYGLNASQIDTHIMKNMEWGAVAYLSHSLYGRYTNSTTCIDSGCEVWTNPNNTYLTGYSGTSVSASRTTGVPWNDSTHGGKSSTTGNLTGVYDMSGGAWEYVMGNVAMASTYSWQAGNSGLSTAPESKYYDAYTNSQNTYTAHQNGKLGDATKETLKTFGSTTGGWYSDNAYFPGSSSVWFLRGGYYNDGSNAGAFLFSCNSGNTDTSHSWRIVLSAEDNN